MDCDVSCGVVQAREPWQTPASVPCENLLWTQFLHKARFALFIYCMFAKFGFAHMSLLHMQHTSISFIVISIFIMEHQVHPQVLQTWNMHLNSKDRWVELISCTRPVSLTGSESNIHHINLFFPTPLCCYWNIHWQRTQGQSWFSLYLGCKPSYFLIITRVVGTKHAIISLFVLWRQPFISSKTPKQYNCNVVLCGDKSLHTF